MLTVRVLPLDHSGLQKFLASVDHTWVDVDPAGVSASALLKGKVAAVLRQALWTSL